MSSMWTCFFMVLVAVTISQADIIDNGLSADPVVECANDGLTVRFRTQKEFEGHVYVKGHYEDPSCRKDATLEESVNLTIPFTNCDVRRQRSSSPRGLYLSVTMIISFHPMFITKVDKSYNVQCFYMEVEKTVTQSLDVESLMFHTKSGCRYTALEQVMVEPITRLFSIGRDMEKGILVVIGDDGHAMDNLTQHRRPTQNDQFDGLQQETLTSSAPLPVCKYEVLSESVSGDPVKFASVGQQVYHQWTCEDAQNKQDSPFCATVHSCNVREESGKQVQLLDENGCAVDKYLLNNLVYTAPLTGGQLSHVFKFADQPTVYFQCQIRLSLKEEGQCRRSSDNCPVTLRGKRSADEKSTRTDPDVDVFSQSMTVFEIDDPALPSVQKTSAAEAGLASDNICLTPVKFGVLISLLGTVLLVTAVTTALLLCRPHTVKVDLAG